jgi:hypothetical protein
VSARDDRLRQTFDALAAIGTRLSLSLRDDANCFPVTSESVSSNEPDMTRALDVFLQRFDQALDHVLRKLFPRLQATITCDDEFLPVRELFENLECAATLNDAWSRAPALLTQIERARLYAERHKLIEGFGR